MNNLSQLSQNTVIDTPSYSQASQLESTGIRELTPEEIELVNGACFEEAMKVGLITGAISAYATGLGGATLGATSLTPHGIAAGFAGGFIAGAVTGSVAGFLGGWVNCKMGV